jgi:hypothetical protein
MKFLRKIVLLGLPEALETAVLEQLRAQADLQTAVGAATDDADLVLLGDEGQGRQDIAPGIPVMSIDLKRPARLGMLVRQLRQILDEPALYLDEFAIGPYRFQPQDRLLAKGAEGDIALTDKETDILVYLAKRAGQAVSRDDLLKHVWRYQEGIDTHTLETHIYRLRQKMEASAENPLFLVTEEGGYRLKL